MTLHKYMVTHLKIDRNGYNEREVLKCHVCDVQVYYIAGKTYRLDRKNIVTYDIQRDPSRFAYLIVDDDCDLELVRKVIAL